MPTLVLMRHATAESSAPSDLERRLTERGQGEASASGEWLAGQGVEADAALVSAATRTEMTWEAVSEAAGWDVEPAYDEGLYEAGPESFLDLVRETDDAVATLVVVGHNPTVTQVAQLLDDGEGDEEAGAGMVTGLAPAAVVVMTFEGDWADLDEASATLTAFHPGAR